jgi:hypothetical protein
MASEGTPASGESPGPAADGTADAPFFDTSVAHVARVYDYWLGGKDNFPADRLAGEQAIQAYPDIGAVPSGSHLVMSHPAADIEADAMAEMAQRLNQLMAEKVTFRGRAQVERFFDGLELVDPGPVRVQKWRPDTELEARSPAALWGAVARKP